MGNESVPNNIVCLSFLSCLLGESRQHPACDRRRRPLAPDQQPVLDPRLHPGRPHPQRHGVLQTCPVRAQDSRREAGQQSQRGDSQPSGQSARGRHHRAQGTPGHCRQWKVH